MLLATCQTAVPHTEKVEEEHAEELRMLIDGWAGVSARPRAHHSA